jgi:hypothetical protein
MLVRLSHIGFYLAFTKKAKFYSVQHDIRARVRAVAYAVVRFGLGRLGANVYYRPKHHFFLPLVIGHRDAIDCRLARNIDHKQVIVGWFQK